MVKRIQRPATEQVILTECLKMVELTGGVTATDSEFNYILEGMVVRDKHTIKKMSKDILNKPVFQLLHDWILCDKIDYQMNKQHVLTLATGYLRRYKDIFAVTPDILYPPIKKVSIEEPVSFASKIRDKIKQARRKKYG
jgi:hypothetical protein